MGWYSGFTGNTSLAESAAVSLDAEAGLNVRRRRRVFISLTFFLVVPRTCNRSGRTSLHADPAGAIREEKAIGVMVRVGSIRRGNAYAATTDPQRIALPTAVIRPSHNPKVPRPAT